MNEETTELPSNPNRQIKLEKVVVSMAVGQSGEPLEKGMKILTELTGCKPCTRKAKKTIKPFGIRKSEPLACMVTLRGNKATDFLKKAFDTINNQLSTKYFDNNGNFSFGVREHIDIPGVKYDPNLGIYGFNINVALQRSGFRVKKRSIKKSRIGKNQVLNKTDAITFIKNNFGVDVVGG